MLFSLTSKQSLRKDVSVLIAEVVMSSNTERSGALCTTFLSEQAMQSVVADTAFMLQGVWQSAIPFTHGEVS